MTRSSIPHKNVRTNDNESVVAANSGSIVVLSRGAREECYIPKIHVEGVYGDEVFLNYTVVELEKFKI